jgi:small subunit ribosomal protein S16
MLAIRMQRTGRKGHAQFRVVVQDSRVTPTSGRVVAGLGSYNPHTKQVILDKEKAAFYLGNGAQPSDRVALLLQKEGVALPSWVKLPTKKEATIKNSDKLRKNRPAEEVAEEAAPEAEAPVEEVAAEEVATEEAPAEA